jgi:ATP-dependent DNA helicase DinG
MQNENEPELPLTEQVLDYFKANGPLATKIGRQFEIRPQQRGMAVEVADALTNNNHLVVEAGTGVGKSFGYLIPAILYAVQQKKRVVISTHTIALQEQIVKKDIPRLQKIMPNFKAVLVKGRSNYISLRRLQIALERRALLFGLDSEENKQLERIAEWVQEEDCKGSISELQQRPSPDVWENISSQTDNCLGVKCSNHKECFYFKARRGVHNAQILVVNHALFFSDLSIRDVSEKNSILPHYDAVVFDEAHTVESVAVEHFGLRISQLGLDYQLSRLRGRNRPELGLLATYGWSHEANLVDAVRKEITPYFKKVWETLGGKNIHTRRAYHPLPGTPKLVLCLNDLIKAMSSRFKEAATEDKALELNSVIDRLTGIQLAILQWHNQSSPGMVYWIEGEFDRRRRSPEPDSDGKFQPTRFEIVGAPLDTGPELRKKLYKKDMSCVMTSATLSVQTPPNFSFFHKKIGFDKSVGKSIQFDSPFQYQKQATIHLYPKMADPTTDKESFFEEAVTRIEQLILENMGRTLVLFTSFDMLRKMADRLRDQLHENGIKLLVQGEGLAPIRLIEEFQKGEPCALLGTDSFWQGIDIPGDDLNQLIVVRLPFSVPDHPLLEARLEDMKQKGTNPFFNYQVPEAIIKFRQGFGRLIRTATDQGTVHVLDPRIKTKPYGKSFLSSLPNCEVKFEVLEECENFDDDDDNDDNSNRSIPF